MTTARRISAFGEIEEGKNDLETNYGGGSEPDRST